MASLLALTRAAPQLRLHVSIRDFTLAEARQWVGLLQNGTASLTAARRAAVLLEIHGRPDARASLNEEARRHFALVSARDRARVPALWARILLATEPAALRDALPTILKATRKATGENRNLAFWILDERMPEDARVILRTWVSTLEDWELAPGVRLSFEVKQLASALEQGRTRAAAAHLGAMTRWAPYCRNATLHVDAVRAAMAFPALDQASLDFVEVLLTQRGHHRGTLLRLRSKLIARAATG